METKRFHISDVLSITPGRLVSTRHIEGVYDILNWMTGESLMTHQLPRASRACEPLLLETFPELADVAADELDALIAAGEPELGCQTWVTRIATQLGKEWFDVPKLPANAYERRNPIEELSGMMRPDQTMIVVQTD